RCRDVTRLPRQRQGLDHVIDAVAKSTRVREFVEVDNLILVIDAHGTNAIGDIRDPGIRIGQLSGASGQGATPTGTRARASCTQVADSVSCQSLRKRLFTWLERRRSISI